MMNNNILRKQKCRELIEKRSACTKVYENEDHTMTAAIYGQPVHYMKDGVWEEIDSRLTDGTEEEGDVENTAGSLKIRLSNQAKEKGMVRIGRGKAKLSWGLKGCATVKRQAVDSAGTAGEGCEAMVVAHLASKVCYPEIYPGVDLACTVRSDSVKEDIFLKGPEAPRRFVWHYQTGQLTAVQKEDAILFMEDDGREVYRLEAPYMTDAAGVRCTDVRLTAEPVEKGREARISLTVSDSWLTDEKRAWPVTIDPVVSTSQKVSDIRDCHVSSYYHTDNFYNSHMLKTGCVDGSVLRSYLKFELPQIDRSADMIISAWFHLVKYPGSGASKRTIDLHRVTGAWEERTITWDNQPASASAVVDYATFATTDQATVSFDVTDLVRNWYTNGGNYGMMIRAHDESGNSTNYAEYLSSDCDEAYAAIRPCILISYVNYSGLEDHWSFHTQTIGRAGTVSVNDYNGNLVFIHDTLHMTGNRMPVALSHVYNSNDRLKDLGYGVVRQIK